MRNELKVYALRLTGNDNDAEDIVQEVLLKLWSMRQKLDHSTNIKARRLPYCAICTTTSAATGSSVKGTLT